MLMGGKRETKLPNKIYFFSKKGIRGCKRGSSKSLIGAPVDIYNITLDRIPPEILSFGL